MKTYSIIKVEEGKYKTKVGEYYHKSEAIYMAGVAKEENPDCDFIVLEFSQKQILTI
jgi:hypothetical protein